MESGAAAPRGWRFQAGEPSRWIMEPPGLLLHEWRDGRGLVSHVDFIGAFEVGSFSDQHPQAPAPHSAIRKALSSSAICTNACCSSTAEGALKYMSGSVAQVSYKVRVSASGEGPKVIV